MNVRECYEIMNGDYEDVKRRDSCRTQESANVHRCCLGDNSMEELKGSKGTKESRERISGRPYTQGHMPESGFCRTLCAGEQDHGNAPRRILREGREGNACRRGGV